MRSRNPWQLALAPPDDEPTPADIRRIEAAVTEQNEVVVRDGERGRSCRCPRPAVDGDRCIWCGHEVERVIA
jgi:hypothetical protein